MKKRKILWAVRLCLLLGLCLLLAGCSEPLKESQVREKAESYLKKLEKMSGVSDHFTVSSKSIQIPDKASEIPVSVSSETYGAGFTVYVSRDLSKVTDDYYTLYLKQEAAEKVAAAFAGVPGAAAVGAEVSLISLSSEALSGHAADSLEKLFALSGSKDLLKIRAKVSEKNELSEAQIDQLLYALQKAGLYGSLYPWASTAKYFQVLPDGFWVLGTTGADSGAYTYRDKYEPK